LSLSQAEQLQAKDDNSSEVQVRILLAQAEKASSEGKFEEALEVSLRAYSLADRKGYDEGRLDSLIKQGFLYWDLGRMKESS